jgi:hypothetical protein
VVNPPLVTVLRSTLLTHVLYLSSFTNTHFIMERRKKIDSDVGISYPLEEFLGSDMPTNEEVLRHLHFQRHSNNKTLSIAALHTARCVLDRWVGTIPQNLIVKPVASQARVLKLYNEYTSLKSTPKVKPALCEKRLEALRLKLPMFLDVSQVDSLEKIPDDCAEDRQWLVNLRAGGVAKKGPIDKVYGKIVKKEVDKKERILERQKKEVERTEKEEKRVKVSLSDITRKS